MSMIDTLAYNEILNMYFMDLFKESKTHYCDMLIVDVDQLSVMRPYNAHIDLYGMLSIDRNCDWIAVDKIDSIMLEYFIKYCLSVNVVSLNGIVSVLDEVSDELNRSCQLGTYFERDHALANMELIKYFSSIKSILASVITYQTKSFESGIELVMDSDDLPPRFYVFNDAKVYFNEMVSVITLTIRFYRKA